MPTGRYRHGKTISRHQKENCRNGSILHNVSWTTTIKKPLELQGASRTGASRPTVFLTAKIQLFFDFATCSSNKSEKHLRGMEKFVSLQGHLEDFAERTTTFMTFKVVSNLKLNEPSLFCGGFVFCIGFKASKTTSETKCISFAVTKKSNY